MAYLFALCWALLLSGCATTTSIRPSGTYRPGGPFVAYQYHKSIVFRVAREATLELGLRIIESAPDESYFIAERGVTLWSWGEVVGVYLVDRGQNSTVVTIKSKRKLAFNITAKDFTGDLFARISMKLNQLSVTFVSAKEPKLHEETNFVTPQSVTQLTKEDSAHEPRTMPASQRWAVIIGISIYHDTRIPSLRYAVADAKAFYNWLISSQGGKFAPSRVKLLLDQDATGKNMKNALFVWLKQALEEDMVTIYFAGHGSPESPDSQNNLFLFPYDIQYDNIASTGFPMWDIETALKRFIKAKKVVVIADACHAGGVGQAFDITRRANRGIRVNSISSGLQSLARIGDGICVISASDNKQFSQEGKNWGGGHGVFTYFLLKGLKGKADYSKDDRVTLGELIPYLSEQVRRATRNAQSPTVAGKFDPALSIAR